eukprot:TRINITY_DN12632_c4_g1_i2.p2 TRINITY_DN12632_c4_g1~~TRINITY_DN12632_c4_g1_i2.p2  ORF type:complete len:395 (+),score=58.85 TRINITY_DN12632_c4_g1_i2:534-1718(+)
MASLPNTQWKCSSRPRTRASLSSLPSDCIGRICLGTCCKNTMTFMTLQPLNWRTTTSLRSIMARHNNGHGILNPGPGTAATCAACQKLESFEQAIQHIPLHRRMIKTLVHMPPYQSHHDNVTDVYKSDPALGEYALVPDDLAKSFRHAYYASVSATDANFGVVLDALNATGQQDNTIIVMIGDHGWQLGDLGEFGKKTNFERATRAPLIVHIPPSLQSEFPQLYEGTPPMRTDALVEFTDIMPTLIDLSGLPSMPLCPTNAKDVAYCTEGATLRPVLSQPDDASNFKDAVFMQYAACMHDDMIWHDACENPAEPEVMGYAVRTRRWRYVEWVKFNQSSFPPTIHWDQRLGVELYDHTEQDIVGNVAESVNLQAQLPDVVEQLRNILHAGWRKFA